MISEYNLVTSNELHSLRRVESLFYLNTISFEIKQKNYTWGILHWDANCVLLGCVYCTFNV